MKGWQLISELVGKFFPPPAKYFEEDFGSREGGISRSCNIKQILPTGAGNSHT